MILDHNLHTHLVDLRSRQPSRTFAFNSPSIFHIFEQNGRIYEEGAVVFLVRKVGHDPVNAQAGDDEEERNHVLHEERI